MCRACLNNLSAHFGVPDAGRIVSRHGKEALFREVDIFLSKPGAKNQIKRNSSNIAVSLISFTKDPNFDPEIAERFISMVEKLHPTTAEDIKRHLPKGISP